MTNFLIKHLIKNADDVKNDQVREAYGTLTSLISILCNAVLCVFKMLVGILSHSVSIQADALNNLSDAGSNVATLFGFKLAGKHPDSDHPYGHGRIEYITGMIIAFLIILVALSSFKESVTKIFHPEAISFSYVTLGVLLFSIAVKLWMGYFNRKIGDKIDSSSLKAASQDSLNDVISTSATLFSLVFAKFNSFPIDGYIGFFVSIFVFKAGLDVFSDTVTPLLGKAPDPAFVNAIHEFVMSHESVIGVHDLMVHDYGPSRCFITLHAEVSSDADLLAIHDEIDQIEREMLVKFHALTTIHMDPIVTNDPFTNELREKTASCVKEINENYSIHDFRIVPGPTHTNLIFDVVLPADDYRDEIALKKVIDEKIKQINPKYYTVINVDHSYI